tara:strand:- start:6290 stop:7195 length:906 start_codon:yes stop_codon:yes gene_type:complete
MTDTELENLLDMYVDGKVSSVIEDTGPKPRGYWKIRDNYERELMIVINNLGHFPTQKELNDINRGDLLNARIYHKEFDQQLRSQYPNTSKKHYGYWQNEENVEAEMAPIVDRLGFFPGRKILTKIGRKDLISAMNKNRKIFASVKKKLGHEEIQKPNGYWKDISNLRDEINMVIDLIGHFPTETELKELKRYGLINAIGKHWGGYQDVRKIFGEEQIRKPKGYWEKRDNVVIELKSLIDKLGFFPSEKKLRSLGKNYLPQAIRNNGGFLAFRKELREYAGQIEIEPDHLESLLDKYTGGNE